MEGNRECRARVTSNQRQRSALCEKLRRGDRNGQGDDDVRCAYLLPNHRLDLYTNDKHMKEHSLRSGTITPTMATCCGAEQGGSCTASLSTLCHFHDAHFLLEPPSNP